ncbi:MAG: tetratricopeptide repeat protein [Phycisphaerae bacterium]|jgi:tetratricopeptide (TPR) repeat protein
MSLKKFLLPAAIVVITVAAYIPAINSSIIWDDDGLITNNSLMRDSQGLIDAWKIPVVKSTYAWPDFYPITWTSLWLEYQLWGPPDSWGATTLASVERTVNNAFPPADPNATWHFQDRHTFGYHFTNVLLHALGSILVWLVLAKLRIPGAWLAGLIFAVHPVNVASVAWLAERKNVLSLVFYLLSILMYLKYDEDGKARWYALSIVAFVLGLMSKTSIVMLPVVLLLLAWWKRKDIGWRGWRLFAVEASVLVGGWVAWKILWHFASPGLGQWQHWIIGAWVVLAVILLPIALVAMAWRKHWSFARSPLALSLPFFVLAGAAARLSMYTQEVVVIQDTLIRSPEENFFYRLAQAGCAPWFYLYKALLPIHLAMIYPRWNIDSWAIGWYLPGVMLVGAFLLLWRFGDKGTRPVLMALAYFVVGLFPVLGFFTMYYFAFSFVADHWQYLSIISVIALAVAAGWKYSRRLPPIVPHLVAAAVVAVLFCMTWSQAGIYKTAETLWKANIALYPQSWMAYSNLGHLKSDEGKLQEALDYYHKCLEYTPRFEKVYINIGDTLARLNRPAEAMDYFGTAIRINPNSVTAVSNYAAMLYMLGRTDEAIAFNQKALQLNPDHTNALHNLAKILIERGQYNQALPITRRLMALEGPSLIGHLDLANLLQLTGQYAEAEEQLRAAFRLDPNNTTALIQMGMLLADTGKPQEAIPFILKYVAAQPSSAEGHFVLGVLRSRTGDLPTADKEITLATSIDPRNAKYRINLAAIRNMQGRTAEAVGLYRELLRDNLNWSEPMNGLASALATCPDASVRNGKEALQLAQRACELTPNRADYLDTLALALAETGDFAAAMEAARKAEGLARDNPFLLVEIQAHLKLLAASQPVRSGSAAPQTAPATSPAK